MQPEEDRKRYVEVRPATLLPGEKETTSSKHAETNGIQISQGVFDSIKAAANDVGISPDDYF